MNDEAVYRTAPATPGLLNIYIYIFVVAFVRKTHYKDNMNLCVHTISFIINDIIWLTLSLFGILTLIFLRFTINLQNLQTYTYFFGSVCDKYTYWNF